MREIKFRAWDKATLELWEPKPQGMIYFDFYNIPYFIDNTYNEENGNWNKRFLIMQYTGLIDKNGKEIYEGDVVETDKENVFEVKFHHGCFWLTDDRNGFELWRQCNMSGGVDSGKTWFKIIGNIYQHPHLLEGAK